MLNGSSLTHDSRKCEAKFIILIPADRGIALAGCTLPNYSLAGQPSIQAAEEYLLSQHQLPNGRDTMCDPPQ